MDFNLSDDQQALIESAGRFAKNKLAPMYRTGDKTGRVDRSLVKAMGDMGFLGPELPEAYGGLGCGLRHQRAAVGANCLW